MSERPESPVITEERWGLWDSRERCWADESASDGSMSTWPTREDALEAVTSRHERPVLIGVHPRRRERATELETEDARLRAEPATVGPEMLRRCRVFASKNSPGERIILKVEPNHGGDGSRVAVTLEWPLGNNCFTWSPRSAIALGRALAELGEIAAAIAAQKGADDA